ncbi:hypothetical protein [Rhodoferax sp.]|uniref:hypothetical protein n=1 Tax=Rhodoferax sp. TaxID=50421 RepID=UPI0025F42C47|nr:hypothetical protein [Rhodoferax sp.]
MKHTFLAVALLSIAAVVHAEPNPAKKELINKIVQLQQPMVEATVRQLAQQPLMQLMQPVGPVIQFRVPPEKREALAKDIQTDIKKYVDDVTPLLTDRANKLAPAEIGSLLDSKFTEDELRQLIVVLESPVLRKFSLLLPDLQKALVDKVVADTKGQVEPKLKALGQSVEKRVNAATPAPSSQPAPGAKPAIK